VKAQVALRISIIHPEEHHHFATDILRRELLILPKERILATRPLSF
jgi:hypothetical protein